MLLALLFSAVAGASPACVDLFEPATVATAQARVHRDVLAARAAITAHLDPDSSYPRILSNADVASVTDADSIGRLPAFRREGHGLFVRIASLIERTGLKSATLELFARRYNDTTPAYRELRRLFERLERIEHEEDSVRAVDASLSLEELRARIDLGEESYERMRSSKLALNPEGRELLAGVMTLRTNTPHGSRRSAIDRYSSLFSSLNPNSEDFEVHAIQTLTRHPEYQGPMLRHLNEQLMRMHAAARRLN